MKCLENADSVGALLLRSPGSCFCVGYGLPAIVSRFLFEVFPPEEWATVSVVLTSEQFHLKRP